MDQSTFIRFDDALPLDAAPRIDLYGLVHKGLRAFMFDTLARMGRCDANDPQDLADTLSATRQLLAVLHGHLHHENDFVHAALEARRPGASRPTAEDHEGHEQAIAALEAAVDELGSIDAARRPRAAYRLYLRLARFVAENLEHMEVEETHLTALLRDAFDDTELAAIHERLVASIPPEELATVHRWIFVGITHDERVGMLSAMREHAPAPVFEGSVARCRDLLAPRDWAKLARALDLPAVAGLVEIW
ncbi:MAG: hypothetical protein EHM87_04910 [Burkholderiales bacterium]|nr:MAG: hypothetical protein EHM87_04910 [Burkholderiales bacterium]